MKNIIEQQKFVENLSDDQLQSQVHSPIGGLPQYLLLAEVKRRADMRKSFQAMNAAKDDGQTVADKYAPQGGQPPQDGPPPQGGPPQGGPMQMPRATDTGRPPQMQPPPKMMAGGGYLSGQPLDTIRIGDIPPSMSDREMGSPPGMAETPAERNQRKIKEYIRRLYEKTVGQEGEKDIKKADGGELLVPFKQVWDLLPSGIPDKNHKHVKGGVYPYLRGDAAYPNGRRSDAEVNRAALAELSKLPYKMGRGTANLVNDIANLPTTMGDVNKNQGEYSVPWKDLPVIGGFAEGYRSLRPAQVDKGVPSVPASNIGPAGAEPVMLTDAGVRDDAKKPPPKAPGAGGLASVRGLGELREWDPNTRKPSTMNSKGITADPSSVAMNAPVLTEEQRYNERINKRLNAYDSDLAAQKKREKAEFLMRWGASTANNKGPFLSALMGGLGDATTQEMQSRELSHKQSSEDLKNIIEMNKNANEIRSERFRGEAGMRNADTRNQTAMLMANAANTLQARLGEMGSSDKAKDSATQEKIAKYRNLTDLYTQAMAVDAQKATNLVGKFSIGKELFKLMNTAISNDDINLKEMDPSELADLLANLKSFLETARRSVVSTEPTKKLGENGFY